MKNRYKPFDFKTQSIDVWKDVKEPVKPVPPEEYKDVTYSTYIASAPFYNTHSCTVENFLWTLNCVDVPDNDIKLKFNICEGDQHVVIDVLKEHKHTVARDSYRRELKAFNKALAVYEKDMVLYRADAEYAKQIIKQNNQLKIDQAIEFLKSHGFVCSFLK